MWYGTHGLACVFLPSYQQALSEDPSSLAVTAQRRRPNCNGLMGVLLAIFLGIVLDGLSQKIQAHEHAVVPLNTQNFEHKTQAASGQTTGNW